MFGISQTSSVSDELRDDKALLLDSNCRFLMMVGRTKTKYRGHSSEKSMTKALGYWDGRHGREAGTTPAKHYANAAYAAKPYNRLGTGAFHP